MSPDHAGIDADNPLDLAYRDGRDVVDIAHLTFADLWAGKADPAT